MDNTVIISLVEYDALKDKINKLERENAEMFAWRHEALDLRKRVKYLEAAMKRVISLINVSAYLGAQTTADAALNGEWRQE